MPKIFKEKVVMMKVQKKNWIFLLLLVVCAIYMGAYIYKTSFISNDTRYFVLFDDAMISMRYAKNFAEGYGLVWNPGETPVEGYTNPLWVIFMAAFHLFPITESKISLAIQLSGAIFLLGNLVMVKKITELISDNFIAPIMAVILTAFYVPLNNWGLQGMEVSVLTLVLSTSSLITIRNLKNEQFSPWPYILLGIGTLIRIDMVVPFLVFIGFLLIFDSKHRWRHLLWGGSLLVFFLASQTLFRLWYYGDPLPNTYYLKMYGFPIFLRIKRGLYVLYKFIRELNWVLFLIPFSVLLFRYDRSTLFLALLILGQMAYSVYVGGDAWEHKGGANRYISIAIPLFFIMFVYGLEQIIKSLLALVKNNKHIIVFFANLGYVAVIIASMINFNFILESQLSIKRMLLLHTPYFVEGPKEYVRIVHAVDKITTPQARVAVVTAGIIPYLSERPTVDLLGKNDTHIAHLPSHIPPSLVDIRPGHMKWDYDYSIGELKPDMVLQLWGDTSRAKPYIEEYYTIVVVDGLELSARTDSPEIIWENVDEIP